MGRNVSTNRNNVGISKNGNRTGELQSYAPKLRIKINCNVAVIGESACWMYFVQFWVIFCVEGWHLMWGNLGGDYQCGFKGERSTVDNLFVLGCILEKCRKLIKYWFSADLRLNKYNIFIWKLIEFGIPKKLVNLMKVTLLDSKGKVKIKDQLTEAIGIGKGLAKRWCNLYSSVSQPSGRGPVSGPGINYTGPREVLLEFAIQVF